MKRSSIIEVRCHCGHAVRVAVYNIVDIATEPNVRKQLEEGRFHNVRCRKCTKRIQIDKWFLCQDSQRNFLAHVFPLEYRAMYHDLAGQLDVLHRICELDQANEVKILFGIVELLAFLRGEPTQPPPLRFRSSEPTGARPLSN
jgi:hypothetical protein